MKIITHPTTSEVEKEERKGFGYKDLNPLNLEEEEIIQFSENHKFYKKVVEEVLEYYPLATNNDFILYIEVLRALDLLEVTSGQTNFVFKIRRDCIKRIPSPESITRARRGLNSEGIGLPTNKNVFIRRMRRQKAIKQYFSKAND